jgi:hypothetical protein
MDLLLPLAVKFRRGENSDLLRLELLLRSVEAFWTGGDTLRIVTPDVPEVTAEVARLRPKLRVVIHSDDEVFGTLVVKTGHWFRQQILKLAAHRVVESDFYLVLDADCFFVRPTSVDDLVPGGRGRVSYGKGIQDQAHSKGEWYSGCRKLGLQVPRTRVNMTPFVMHRQLAADAVECVQGRLGSIAKLRWTEYTLYHALAVERGTWDAHHVEGVPLLGNEVWTGNRLRGWDPAKCFVAGDFHLSLVQSATGMSAAWVRSRVLPHIDKALQQR